MTWQLGQGEVEDLLAEGALEAALANPLGASHSVRDFSSSCSAILVV